MPLGALKGLAAPDVEPIYTRLGELCQQRGKSLTESFPIVIELWGFYANRDDLRRAQMYAEQCLTLAQRADASPSSLPKAHWALGYTLVNPLQVGIKSFSKWKSARLFSWDLRHQSVPKSMLC